MWGSILVNTVIAGGGRVVTAVLGIVAVGLLTRMLGPEQFGHYAWLLALGAIAQLVADGGLYLSFTRVLAQTPERAARLLSEVATLRLLLLALVFGVAAGGVYLVPTVRPLVPAFVVVAVGLALQSLSQLYMGAFQYYRSIWRATAGDVVGRLLQIAGVLWVARWYPTVTGAVMVLTGSMAVSWVVHQLLLPGAVRWRPVAAWVAWRGWVVSSWPLGAMLLLNAIYFRIDTLMLTFLRSSAEVGWYGVAYRVIESALFFPAMFGGLLLPRLAAAAAAQRTADVRQYIEEGLRVLVVGAVGVLLVVGLFAPVLIRLIAGPAFAPAGPLLRVLSVALAAMFLGNLFGFTLVALQQQRRLLTLYAWLVVGNVAANFLLIPRWGALAAAWTTVATELIAMTVAGWLVWRLTRFRVSGFFVGRLAVVVLLLVVWRWGVSAWSPAWQLLSVVVVFSGSVWWCRLLPFAQLRLLLARV